MILLLFSNTVTVLQVVCVAGKQCKCRFFVVQHYTFAFISSRPTVATVLVCCLFFFPSFSGLSRRCSRCLITWFHPEHSSTEGERAEIGEGDKRDSRGKSLFTLMSALKFLPLTLLYSYVFGC